MRWLNKIARPKRAPRAPRAMRAPWRGERVDVEAYWAEAWGELCARQAAIARRHGLALAQWHVDQTTGLIHFTRGDGARLAAPVQIIGAWNPRRETLLWGWEHPSVVPRLALDAERTRRFGEAHRLEELTRPAVRATEFEAWRLAAVAMKVNGAAGVYRGPSEGPIVFMTMGELREAG